MLLLPVVAGEAEPIARVPQRSTNPSGSLAEEWTRGGDGCYRVGLSKCGGLRLKERGPAGRQASSEGTW